MTTSLIISTYNRPDALSVCLDSVMKQCVLPDEVIIGDDGSGEETQRVVKYFQERFPIPLIHEWHEDNGFRLAMMRNKCVARASGDYIIETDGDVFLHSMFVADHVRQARRGCYVKGGRTNLGKTLTDEICRQRKSRRIRFWTKGIENKPENAIWSRLLSDILVTRYKGRSLALGCNLSFFRDDFIAVNGYDEFFEGWGGEDLDLGYRFRNYGLKKRTLKFAGILYHLWHEDLYMQNLHKNMNQASISNQNKRVRCDEGVNKYLSR